VTVVGVAELQEALPTLTIRGDKRFEEPSDKWFVKLFILLLLLLVVSVSLLLLLLGLEVRSEGGFRRLLLVIRYKFLS
jgi:hypothetical protein